jgi:hypothetical protein
VKAETAKTESEKRAIGRTTRTERTIKTFLVFRSKLGAKDWDLSMKIFCR